MENLISIKNLNIGFQSQNKKTDVVHSISFDIPKGKTVALVGESGSGKTVTALSILKLLPYPSAYHKSGEIFYNKKNLLNISNREIQKIRGNKGVCFRDNLGKRVQNSMIQGGGNFVGTAVFSAAAGVFFPPAVVAAGIFGGIVGSMSTSSVQKKVKLETKKGIKLNVYGAIAPSVLRDSVINRYVVSDVVTPLRSLIMAEKEKIDINILLLYGNLVMAKSISQRVPDIDVILFSGDGKKQSVKRSPAGVKRSPEGAERYVDADDLGSVVCSMCM